MIVKPRFYDARRRLRQEEGLRQGGGGPGIDIIERGLLVSSKCHVDLPIASTAATATTAAIATATAAAGAATTLPTVAALVKAKTREMMDGC